MAGQWEQGDIVMAEHARHFPRCPFICNLPVGNIPIEIPPRVSERDIPPSRLNCERPARFIPLETSQDVCGPRETRIICERPKRPARKKAKEEEKKEESQDESLEEEVTRLRESKQCKICMENDVSAVFLYCGHVISCLSCAEKVTDCPLCRQPIYSIMRIYM